MRLLGPQAVRLDYSAARGPLYNRGVGQNGQLFSGLYGALPSRGWRPYVMSVEYF